MSKFEQLVQWGDRSPTLGGIIGSWSAYVSQIARDMAQYPAEVIGSFGYDDFVGALFTRNALERGIQQLSVSDEDGEFHIIRTVDLTRPGMSGDRIPWKDLSHGTSQQVPARAS